MIEVILQFAFKEINVTLQTKNYQICTRCIMDTSDNQIQFDSQGVCSHCKNYDLMTKNWPLDQYIKENRLKLMFDEIKRKGAGHKYDCIIGLSGGVDSSYIAILAHEYGLRPLCIHLDNGWNSELAVSNIFEIVKRFNFDLHTHVIDWEEFKDLQRSFFKADVVDIEVLSDHAIFGIILQLAKKNNIRSILSGANISSEFIMPLSWVHRKQDLTNIKDIQRKFGTLKIKSFPQVSTIQHVISMYLLRFKVYKPLNFMNYEKDKIKKLLQDKIGWRDYGGKHHESIFTKFYQSYILPKKFNIDKRRPHYSTLICSQQMSRDEALELIKAPLYDTVSLAQDFEFVCKKLDFSETEMKSYIAREPKPHSFYKSDQWVYDILSWIQKKLKL